LLDSLLGSLLGSLLAAPTRRHLLFIGDGSFQLTAQEISTILRHDMKPVIFVVSAFLISIPLSFYFSFAPVFCDQMGMVNATGKTVYGQVSEIFFLVVMPWFFVRLGVKWMLMVGMAEATHRPSMPVARA